MQSPVSPAADVRPAADPEIAFWSARVARDPEDHVSATRLGYACLKAARRTGDFRLYAQAEAALGEALKRSPGHYTALLGLANARSARHRFQEAIDLARQAAAQQPKDADAYTIIGDAYLGMGSWLTPRRPTRKWPRARRDSSPRRAWPISRRRVATRVRRLRSSARPWTMRPRRICRSSRSRGAA